MKVWEKNFSQIVFFQIIKKNQQNIKIYIWYEYLYINQEMFSFLVYLYFGNWYE